MQMKGGMVGGYEVLINNAVTMHVDEIVTYCKATHLARGMMMTVKVQVGIIRT